MVDIRLPVSRRSARPWTTRYRVRSVAVCLIGTSLLMGCDTTQLPPSGFATRYVMSWSQGRETDSSGPPSEVVSYPDEACRHLAQTRVSDAALSLSFEPSGSDRRKMFDFTYAHCAKWHGQ